MGTVEKDGGGFSRQAGVKRGLQRIGGKGALHHRVQIGIASAQKQCPEDAVLHFAFYAQGAECLRVQIEGAGAAYKALQRLLLTGTQLRQQRRHFGGGDRLNLPAVLVMEIADAQQAALTQKALRDAALIGARLLLLYG